MVGGSRRLIGPNPEQIQRAPHKQLPVLPLLRRRLGPAAGQVHLVVRDMIRSVRPVVFRDVLRVLGLQEQDFVEAFHGEVVDVGLRLLCFESPE